MDFAMWAYPWDLLDEGVTDVAERLQDMGITELNLATNYHHVQAFAPHNPERRTFFARASSYFQPGNDYGTLRPIPNETMGDDDWIEAIATELADVDISLNSWTVGVHNSRLGMQYPDATIENAFGDHLVFGLCPSKPVVQTYLRTLIRDLSNRDIFDRIELETFDFFYGTGFGWHHAKFHTQLGTLGEFLYGLCFCPECRSHAVEREIDVEQVQATVRDTIDAIVTTERSHETDVSAWLNEHPETQAYVDAREEVLTELFSDLSQASGAADLGYYVGLLSVEDTWMQGIDLQALADEVDYYTVIAYESSRRTAVECLDDAASLTSNIPLHAGVLPGYPAVRDRETVTEMVDGLAEAGAPRISFYNYGLLPEQNLDWIADATEPYR